MQMQSICRYYCVKEKRFGPERNIFGGENPEDLGRKVTLV